MGYATAGYSTVSRDGSRSDNMRGSDATTSLVPMHAITSSTVSEQPKRRATQPTAASRKPGLPMVAG